MIARVGRTVDHDPSVRDETPAWPVSAASRAEHAIARLLGAFKLSSTDDDPQFPFLGVQNIGDTYPRLWHVRAIDSESRRHTFPTPTRAHARGC